MRRTRILFAAILLLSPVPCRAADVLHEIPKDLLGFVLIRNLSNFDSKVGQLAALLQRNVPRPLAFLKDVTGVSDGLNSNGDLVVAFIAADGSNGRAQFCVWLPVVDYDRFIKSVGGTSIDEVAAATIAGEDVLIAHCREWAVIMDPDQRERIMELAAAKPSAPALADWGGWIDAKGATQPKYDTWRKWIDSNDVTVVAFGPGVIALVDWLQIVEDGAQKQSDPGDPFGARNGPANRRDFAANAFRTGPDVLESAKTALRRWCAATPDVTNTIVQANLIACGLRLDANNNGLASVRVAMPMEPELPKDLIKLLNDGAENHPIDLPFSTYESGGFVLLGGGSLQPPVLTRIAIAYAQLTAAELSESEGKLQFDDDALKRMQIAVDNAAAEVRSAIILSQPGDEPQPVYTNDFVALRVASASNFVKHANEVMRLWNKANRDAKGEMLFVFDVEEVKVGERIATQYALDMAGLAGGVILPEVRQSMEKLFGPGGKLRFWIVPADDNTVLIASAMPDQIAKALKAFDRKQKIEWKGDQLSECNALLPAESDWRIFVNLHRYFDWVGREASAVVGVPVIGGPLVKSFPASPPIGIAGGIRDDEVWLDAVALGPTIKSADTYLTRGRSRTPFQMRARVVPGAPRPAPAPPNK
jgi:hypothetical protein